MRFATIIATAALAMGVAAEPNADDLPFNVISSRIWSSSDCGGGHNVGNLGELTTHRDELGQCFKFSEKPKSVSQSEHADGCKLLLFTDTNCKRGQKTLNDGQCRATSSHFGSWKTVCSQVA
ncbi:hypothetical protein IL306_010210 [Fusarium sp. DS 682]|nr:hypothetical protein IL306_010210 [Fusarium sp. DS 682]